MKNITEASIFPMLSANNNIDDDLSTDSVELKSSNINPILEDSTNGLLALWHKRTIHIFKIMFGAYFDQPAKLCRHLVL